MNFEIPYLLMLILPLVAAVVYQLRKLSDVSSKRRYVIMTISLTLLIIALANPYWQFAPQPQLVKGIDLAIVVDVSQSMFCEDGSPRRIDQAKNFIRGMLPRFAGSSAGLIYFAKDAQIGIPMTPDLTAIQVFLDSITPRMTLKAGTQTQEISAALEELLEKDSGRMRKQRLILFFSDGEFKDNAGRLAGTITSRRDTTLITFLCGRKKSPVPEYDLSRNHPGAFSSPDPARLQALVDVTGGTMYELSRVSSSILENNLLGRARDIEMFGKPAPDYQAFPFAAAGLVLLLIHQLVPAILQLLRKTRFRTAVAAAFLSVFIMGMNGTGPTSEFRQALKEASEKKYEQALRRLQTLKLQGASEELDVAIGNLFFAQNQFDQAILHYRSALHRNPANQRARWNWEIALKRKQNPNPPPDQPPPTGKAPDEVPEQTKSLLKYFDQLEADLMKQNNTRKTGPEEFDW